MGRQRLVGLGFGGGYDRLLLYAPSYVSALAVSGTNLYAGGSFTVAGGVAVANIAKWDGSAWSALGSGMGDTYTPVSYALAVSGTNLYAGGCFTTAGGVSANNIAKWNGSAWSALGSGIVGQPEWCEVLCQCAGGERDQSLRWGGVQHGGRRGWPIPSPNGTVVFGRPWARV